MKERIKAWLAAAAILLICAFSTGCGGAQWFSANTQATYEAYGAKLTYDSSKNQENFHARIELDPEGRVKALDVKTTATTAESAIAAAAASMAAMADAVRTAIQELAPLAKAAAMSGS